MKRETKWNISKTIAEDYEGKTLNLESRIRNNKEISSFIRLLLNKINLTIFGILKILK